MSLEIMLLAVLLSGGMLAVITLPFLGGEADPAPAYRRSGPQGTQRQNDALETLWLEKRRTLRAVRDLDFDYDMGKVAPDLYAQQRVELVRLAVAIMKRMDAIEDEILAQQVRIDAAISAYRQSVGTASASRRAAAPATPDEPEPARVAREA